MLTRYVPVLVSWSMASSIEECAGRVKAWHRKHRLAKGCMGLLKFAVNESKKESSNLSCEEIDYRSMAFELSRS